MPWGRMDDKFWRNPKQLSMSNAAFRVWVLSWSYCADTPDPNGFITTTEALTLARQHSLGQKTIDEIVTKAGWEIVPGGYLVHDFDVYLPKKSTERVRAFRERKRNGAATEAKPFPPRARARRVPVPVPVPVSGEVGDQELPLQTKNRSVLAESEDGGREVVRQVFEAWLQSTQRTSRTRLDEKRRRLIRRALDQYPLEDVLDAMEGWRFSTHHRGENESKTVYNDLELILRDARHIEQFRDFKRGARTGSGPVHRLDRWARDVLGGSDATT